METRIKIVTNNNGAQKYFPQYKSLIFWLNFEEHKGWDFYEDICFDSIEAAKRFIDQQIGVLTKIISYVKYP